MRKFIRRGNISLERDNVKWYKELETHETKRLADVGKRVYLN